ncbi:MAG TPA: hypothetical protein VMS19_07775 [Methyloceanibacter sp.]|jgi:hypothetical protein|nr:hypothetical protein [Methyloceanibacter sp.]
MAALLGGWGSVVCSEALAQVERRQLPVLPGEAPPQPDQDFGEPPGAPVETPPADGWSPSTEAPLPAIRQSAGAQGDSALPPDLWRGLDGSAIQRLLGQVPMPSTSPALASLLARALAASPEGGSDASVRIAALERAGRVNELIDMLGQTNEPGAPYALALLAAGRTEDACAVQLGASGEAGIAAKRASFLIPVYCAALSGDKEAARQALGVARDNGVDAGFAARAVDGQAQRAALPQRVDVLDYLFIKLGQGSGRADLAAKATPELLFLLARDDEAPAELRLAAAERAASLNVIDGEMLANVYADAAPKLPKSAQSPAALRAKLFAALESQTSEKIRAESIDALLASGKDARIEIPMAQAMAKASGGFAQDTQSASFAETGVRVAALAGDDQTAWDLTEQAGDRVRSWQLLLVTTDPLSERARTALDSGVDIALKAGLPGPLLQRLVTALDALGEEVPIPLWDLAAKTPQPDDGYLPPTGVLSALKEAADRGETGLTILLAASAFGPDGPQGAHLIALGDGLRALKRVGLETEARRLAFEALYAHWPARGKA